MSISKQDVAHVAGLAHLTLDAEEIEAMTRDLNAILEYASNLDALDLQQIDAAAANEGRGTPCRADEEASGLSADQALATAPETRDGHYRVPPVLGGE